MTPLDPVRSNFPHFSRSSKKIQKTYVLEQSLCKNAPRLAKAIAIDLSDVPPACANVFVTTRPSTFGAGGFLFEGFVLYSMMSFIVHHICIKPSFTKQLVECSPSIRPGCLGHYVRAESGLSLLCGRFTQNHPNYAA